MNKNKKTNKPRFSFKTVLTSRGFYIALLTLIMVVGTVSVVRKFTVGVNTQSSSFDDSAWEDAIAEADIDLGTDVETCEEIPIDENLPETEEDFPELVEGETVAAAKQLSDEELLKELDMTAPCTGEILKAHSPDRLIYSKTTNDWRTHNGIDISAKEGSIVSAAADGVVEEVYEDKKLGIVVVIGHSESIKTLYANLQDLSFIEVGRKVAKGDTIGAVGSSALVEKKDKPHLHFEIIKTEISQNPSEYIPL